MNDDGQGYVLGFASAIRNIGSAPLVLEGSRLQLGSTTPMQVNQVLEDADGRRTCCPTWVS